MLTLWRQLYKLPDACRHVLNVAVLWMVFSAILNGVSGLLLASALLKGGAELQWPMATLGALFGVTMIQAGVAYYAARRGFMAGGGMASGLIIQLIQHLPQVRQVKLQSLTSPQMLFQGPVMQAMSIPAHLLAPMVAAVVTPLTVVIGVFFIHVGVAVGLLLSGILLLVVLSWSRSRQRQAALERETAEHAFAEEVQAFADCQSLLRAAGRNSEPRQRLDRSLTQLYLNSRTLLLRGLPGHLGFAVCVQGGLALALSWGVYLLAQGDIAGLQLLVAFILLVRFVEPLTVLSHLDQALDHACHALDQLIAVLAAPKLTYPHSGHQPHGAQVEAQNVAWRAGDQYRLANISFIAPDKKMTVIIGPSGAGKSSLLALLARLDDPDQGQVLIGGCDVCQMTEQSLAHQRTCVFQGPSLISGSVAWNVSMSAPAASQAELDQAAEQAAILSDIRRWPTQWAHQVGPSGQLLSGGQRQRLALARAFLSPSPVLLLDEPTSSLDAVSAGCVMRQLVALKAHKTVIVMTHQPELARQADHLLFLQQGRLVDQGHPDAVAERQPWVADFFTDIDH